MRKRQRNTYRCENPYCGVEESRRIDVAVFGTCHECGTGFMRRVAKPKPEPMIPRQDVLGYREDA